MIFLMIGNPTRLSGYFYKSHFTELKDVFTTLHYSSEDSPIADNQLKRNLLLQFGEDSDEYRTDRL